MTAVVPLADLGSRMPVVGKLRHGVFKGNRPVAIDTWRMTTSSQPFAESFAEAYGGTVQRMTNSNSPHEWEVISDATELAIALVPDGFQQSYELWSAGGCQRRCDGVTVGVLQTTGPDSVEYVDSPCICDRKNELECSLKTRLTVVLPNLPFRGGLVYETSSANFAQESRGMIALIQQLQASGITRGVLRLEKRKSTGGRRYTTAALGVLESIDALQSGETHVRALGTAPAAPDAAPELEAPSAPASPSGVEEREPVVPPAAGSLPTSDDEDIVDAEIVEDDDPAEAAKLRATFMAIVQGEVCGLSYEHDVKPFLKHHYKAGWSDLSMEQRQVLVRHLTGGKNRAEKEAAQREFAKKVRALKKKEESK